MKAVITGDIINSRTVEVSQWLPVLKETLDNYGSEPRQWEIFRGDSFQMILLPEKALMAAIHIKASIRMIKGLDVRMAIGIGEQDFEGNKVSESNGSAFVHSGDCFESLNKQQLAIQTSNRQFNETLNLMLSLALLTMDLWRPGMAGAVKISLEKSDKNQKEIAKILNKSQSSLSESLARGGFDEVMRLNEYYKKQLRELW